MTGNRWTILTLVGLTLGSGGALLQSGAFASPEVVPATRANTPIMLAQVTPEKKDGDPAAADTPDGDAADEDKDKKKVVDPKTPAEWRELLKKKETEITDLKGQLDTVAQKMGLQEKNAKEAAAKAAKNIEAWKLKCRGGPRGGVGSALGPPEVEEKRLAGVAKILKKMRPESAARMVDGWTEPLTIDIFWRVPARIAAPILAAMPPKDAAKITTGMADARLKKKTQKDDEPADGAPADGADANADGAGTGLDAGDEPPAAGTDPAPKKRDPNAKITPIKKPEPKGNPS